MDLLIAAKTLQTLRSCTFTRHSLVGFGDVPNSVIGNTCLGLLWPTSGKELSEVEFLHIRLMNV